MIEPKSPRLRFRPPVEEDWRDILAYRASPEWPAFHGEGDPDEAWALAFVHRFLAWREERPPRRFAYMVALAPDQPSIGLCSLRMESADATTAEIGFELAPWLWGRGYATEIAEALLRAGFDELGLHRVQAHCIDANVASRRVLEKVGMVLEGRLREKHRVDGRFHDELWFGILASEWRLSRGEAPA